MFVPILNVNLILITKLLCKLWKYNTNENLDIREYLTGTFALFFSLILKMKWDSVGVVFACMLFGS